MPLFAVNEDTHPITRIPHRAEFDRWRLALTLAEQQAIDDELDRRIRAKMATNEDIVTAGWLPSEFPNGSDDWSQTPFEVIYFKACRHSRQQTAQCFGLFVWAHMMNRPENWHFMECELDDVPIESMTYFRCKRQHS
jgi:hypothetical protein